MNNIINTLHCNFQCDHCLWSCSPKNHDYMTKQTFMEAVKFSKEYDSDGINLLGGETFSHPDIMWQIEYLLGIFDIVRIVTNGSLLIAPSHNPTRLLNELEERFYGNEHLQFCVSRDQYHEAFISRHRVEALRRMLKNMDFQVEESSGDWYRRHVYPLGRAKKTGCSCYDRNCGADCAEDGFQAYSIFPNGQVALCCSGMNIFGHISEDFDDLYKKGQKIYKSHKHYKMRNCEICKKYHDSYPSEVRRVYQTLVRRKQLSF